MHSSPLYSSVLHVALTFQCTLPFELGSSRRRTRAYSFSGSERSQTATPTPSEDATVEQQSKEEGVREEVPKEAEGDAASDESSTKEEIGQDKTKKLPLLKEDDNRLTVSPPCEVSSTTSQSSDTANGNSAKKTTVAPTVSTEKKHVESIGDLNNTVKKTTDQADNEQEKTTTVKLGIVAETSETVEIEGEEEDEEEVELEEIDDVEPEDEKAGDNEKKGDENVEETEKNLTEKDTSEKKKKEGGKETSEDEEIDDVEPEVEEILDDDDEAATIVTATGSPAVDTSRLLASGVSVTMVDKKKGPSEETQKSVEEKPEEEDERMAVDEPKGKKAEDTSSKVPSDMGLGSDISVTVVQKKKDMGLPRISVKKESELLESATGAASAASGESAAAKDVVNVHLRRSAKKSFPRKSIDSDGGGEEKNATGGKSPPDPIVTISKVQSIVTGGNKESAATSATKASQLIGAEKPRTPNTGAVVPKSNPSTSLNAAVAAAAAAAAASLTSGSQPPVPPTSSLPTRPLSMPGVPTSSVVSSLASILGAPRSGPPHPPGGTYRLPPPGMGPPPSAGPPPPSSALMRLGGSGQLLRGTHPSSQQSMGMPSLHPRPPTASLTSSTSASPGLLPPAAGPVSEQMHKMAGKLVDYMRGTLEDLFRELASQGSLEAQVKALQLELEKMQWRHQQELSEAKHNTDLILMEMRQSMEAEKQKLLSDVKKQV